MPSFIDVFSRRLCLRNRHRRHADIRGAALSDGKAMPVGEPQEGLHLCAGLPVNRAASTWRLNSFFSRKNVFSFETMLPLKRQAWCPRAYSIAPSEKAGLAQNRIVHELTPEWLFLSAQEFNRLRLFSRTNPSEMLDLRRCVSGARSKHNCACLTHKLNPIIDVGSWDYAAGSRAIPIPAHSIPVQPCWASN